MDGREAGAGLSASLLLDGEDRILEGNRDAEAFLERPLEEVRKTRLSEANPALYSALKEMLAKTKRGRGVEDYALAYKVGKRLMRLSISITPYPLEALGTTGTLVTINAVGARPAPETRAARKKEQAPPPPVGGIEGLQGFLGMLSDPVFMLDMEANFVYANPAMGFLLGHPRDEIIGRPLSFFLRREEAKASLEGLVEAARSAPWRGELELSRKDGSACVIAATIEALKGGRGKTERLLCIGRDCTAEARIRREREEEVMRVWSLLERAGLALACFTPDFRVTLLSQFACDLLSTTSDRAIGARLPELFPPPVREEIAPLLEQALRQEIRGCEVRLGGDEEGGRILYLDIRPAVISGDKPREYMMVMREATEELSERKRMEELLRESRMRASLLERALGKRGGDELLEEYLDFLGEEFGYASAAAFLVQRRDVRLAARRGLRDEAAETLRKLRLRPGYARQCAGMEKLSLEMHGGIPRKGWKELHSLVEKADNLLPLLREERWRGLLILPLRGEEISGAVACADCDPAKTAQYDDRKLAAMAAVMASALDAVGKPPAGEDSSAVATAEPGGGGTVAPGEEENSGPAAVEEKSAGTGEVEEERARRGVKSVREHDYFEIARETRKDEEAPDNLPLWGERELERPELSPRGIDISSLLWELKEMFGWGQKRSEIFLELEEDLPKLHADRHLLREAVTQLLDNALKHSPPGAPVILGAERWGDEVLLRVEDQGTGIPYEVLDRLGEAETGGAVEGGKKVSGLVLCRRYVEAMGGSFSIKGRPGEGTTAFIRLRVLPFVGEGD